MVDQDRRALLPSRSEISELPLSSNSRVASELLSGTGTSVLDIGCGEGKFTRALASIFAKVKGVDIKPKKIEEASAAAAKEGVSVAFEVASGESLPDPSACFDTVIFSNSLHHMPDPERALCEALRVLKTGGYLYVMEPVASGNYHDATCLVNDETEVRKLAYEELRKLSGTEWVREILYRGRRTFLNFEDWKADQIDRDEKRKSMFDAQPELVRERFMTNAERESDGKLGFDQVYRVNLLRKL